MIVWHISTNLIYSSLSCASPSRAELCQRINSLIDARFMGSVELYRSALHSVVMIKEPRQDKLIWSVLILWWQMYISHSDLRRISENVKNCSKEIYWWTVTDYQHFEAVFCHHRRWHKNSQNVDDHLAEKQNDTSFV